MGLWLDRIGSIFRWLLPRKGFRVTPVLVLLNLVVWGLTVATGLDVLAPDSSGLLDWGANLGMRVLEGEVWRLVAALFLHAGVVHLLMSVVVLTVIGMDLERRIGGVRFAVAYLVGGIGANLVSALLEAHVVRVGASGAIFGLVGCHLSLLLLNVFPPKVKKWSLIVLGAFLVAHLLNLSQQGVDHWAHFGGLVTGLMTGVAMRFTIRKKAAEKEGKVAEAGSVQVGGDPEQDGSEVRENALLKGVAEVASPDDGQAVMEDSPTLSDLAEGEPLEEEVPALGDDEVEVFQVDPLLRISDEKVDEGLSSLGAGLNLKEDEGVGMLTKTDDRHV